jgi:hypothetical protein
MSPIRRHAAPKAAFCSLIGTSTLLSRRLDLARRARTRPLGFCCRDHPFFNARRGPADLRRLAHAARNIGAGVWCRVICGGPFDHRFRAFQLTVRGVASRDDDRGWCRPDARADRGRRNQRCARQRRLRAERVSRTARVRRGRRGFSGEAQEDFVEWVRARTRAVPINIISEVKEMGALRFAHATNKSVSSR